VLGHQDRVLRRDPLDQGRDLVDVLMTHAGHRLVQQHDLRIEGERRRQLERALATVGHVDRLDVAEGAQTDVAEQLPGAGVVGLEHTLRAPEIERRSVPALQVTLTFRARSGRETAEIWNERTSPSRATSGGAVAGMSRPSLRIWPALGCRTLVSRLKQVVLPAPLGPISAWIRPAPDLEVDAADGEEASELLCQSADFQNDVTGHGRPSSAGS
jgi:hypothetical protein